MPNVTSKVEERTLVVTIERPQVRNAVDGPTARELADAFRRFEDDDALDVAILRGAGDTFCSGADLHALAHEPQRANALSRDGDGPMGPTRMRLGKPVIAAVEGHAVAGGFELALWCDVRIAGESAVFGFLNRRWGVPLVDGGTVRLPAIVGLGRALELILTGRRVGAAEGAAIGLVNQVVADGGSLAAARSLAQDLTRLPQRALRSDRISALEAASADAAMRNEFERGLQTIAAGGIDEGARRFTERRTKEER